MNANFASKPRPFLASRASGSVVLWCVAFERFSPRKLKVGLPRSSGGSSAGGLSLGRKALEAGGGLDQRAVNGEVLVREQPQRIRLAYHRVEELQGDDMLQ